MDFTPKQFARLSRWFDEGVALQLPAREVLIQKVRREEGDKMAQELARLLSADAAPTETIDQPLVHFPWLQEPGITAAFKEGEVILGRFRIVRALGRGGMGEVYEAQDQELGPVALKTIRRQLLGDQAVLRRFKQEVQLARQVTSPYVCRIHELFMLADRDHDHVAAFLTMELLEGMTLAKRIEQGPLPWVEAEPIAIELCQGLEALHRIGLVHRDFKPANAMLAKRGNVTQAVVMDLGLALRPDESLHGHPKLTLAGHIVGTPGYMAPEQFEGATVSAATDIYALGLVLYEMTTGRPPFEASTPLAAAVMRAKRPPAASSIQPGLPRRLDRVIEKCLEFEPAGRFRSAAAVAKALRGGTLASWGLFGRLRAPSVHGDNAHSGRQHSRRALLYWGAGAMAAGAATAWFWPNFETRTHPLPKRRLVAAMLWPQLTDPDSVSLAGQVLATVSRELARAEAYDTDFLILASSAPGRNYAAATPTEAAGILGANLVLAISLVPSFRGPQVALSVIDPAKASGPLRQATVGGNTPKLSEHAVETAARLLNVRLHPGGKAGDEFANVRPAAYQLYLSAQEQMRLPNTEGLDSAIEKYQAALSEDPRFAAAYAGLAIAYGRRYAFRKDQSDLALASRNSKLALEYGPAASSAKFSQALIKLYSGDTEQALQMFRELLDSDPGNEDVMMYEAQAFRETNRIDLEEKVYQNLLNRRPNFWPAYNDLGLIYRRKADKADYDSAVANFLQATRIAPRAAIPWTNLGAAYFLRGEIAEARDACLHAIANHPSEDALVILGDIAYYARDYSAALDYYRHASDINPKGHIVWQSMGDCYTMLHQPDQTRKCYQKAAEILAGDLKINPRFGRNWMIMAYYSAKLGDRPQAMQQLTEAEQRGARDLESQLLKAQIFVLTGERQKGIDLAVDLLNRGLSRVEIGLAVDLQGVLNDPRLHAALQNSK